MLFSGTIYGEATEERIARSYRQAVAGDKSAVEHCLELLELIVSQEPQNQLARAYLGSCYTLRSRDMSFGLAKLHTLNHGLALMDQAVASAPEDPQVRLVRARTTDALPAFLGRARQSREDFSWLVQVARRTPERFTAEDLAAIRQHGR
jgi:hypothetical protein